MLVAQAVISLPQTVLGAKYPGEFMGLYVDEAPVRPPACYQPIFLACLSLARWALKAFASPGVPSSWMLVALQSVQITCLMAEALTHCFLIGMLKTFEKAPKRRGSQT